MEKFDCIVVGAGWYGLAAAKQYHCTQPESSLVVFDSQPTLGGTWAKERLYPGLKSNNMLGTYEYPDFPMDSKRFNIKPGQHIPGETISIYLKAYADKFGITDKIRSCHKVIVAEHQETSEGGWFLTVANSQNGEIRVFARRLIIATGLTSEPWLPHFDGQESFGGRIFHGKYFQQNADTLETANTVTIFGGTKFAWDAVYSYATAGVKVNWIIRYTRMLTWFSPCLWGDADGYIETRHFLHGTAIGRTIVDTFWKVLGGDVMTLNAYDSHPDTAKLKPWTEAMFTGTSFSILNYDTNFFDLVKKGKVKVHLGEIDHLSSGTVHLSDGTKFSADVLLAHTGWKHVPPIKFLPEGIETELGIPHAPINNAPREDLAGQADLVDLADKEILARFPRLKDQPVWNKDYVPLTDQKGIDSDDAVTPYRTLTPYMLHHFIVPPSERFLRPRDTAFIGMVGNFSNVITAHVQGLWISAYFSGLLARDPAKAVGDDTAMQKLQYNTILMNRFGNWRYPTDWGSNKCPSFVFDAVPYLDLLLSDLGLAHYRKRGFMAEWYSPYGPEDYSDINEEWDKKFAKGKGIGATSGQD
ncbi:hypothetical protein CTAM01_08476 [Colletotrichum tamarilloi]|uniref:Uncharacterized protein n=1 Tax=Colletotrichum tamarilloi TaxID=1209934 RepID=A0ABQ9R6Y8_9PEZI|nr:uncharacterized protein CTAM01_08476 [Colletotrichum tamarilloi]KAK1496289.1 hypothetical protein CTAM01_08476 [Colletotrichum tamarilloi]